MGKDLNGKELGKGFTQKKDGRYEARAVINGEKICMSGFNLSELKRQFEKEKRNLQRKDISTRSDVTLSEWFEVWFNTYKKQTLKPTAIDSYKRKFVNTFGRHIGFIKMNSLTQLIVQTAVNDLLAENYSFKTIRNALGVLKGCLDSAMGNGLIEKNVCLGVIVPTYSEVTEERRVLSKEEQRIFLEEVENSFYKEVYHFMLSTGVRVGELGALRWEDIDFKNNFISINKSLSCVYSNGKKTLMVTSPKTKNSIRKIPFFGETRQILLDQKVKQDDLKRRLGNKWRSENSVEGLDNLVFTSSLGSPITRYVLSTDMRSISKDINNKELINANSEGRPAKAFDFVHPHALRHTFATRCFEKKMTPGVVQKIMGHANINMTMSYTHVLDDMLKSEVSVMGNFFDE